MKRHIEDGRGEQNVLELIKQLIVVRPTIVQCTHAMIDVGRHDDKRLLELRL